MNKQIPPEMELAYRWWNRMAVGLRYLFVLLGVSATIAALGVTAFTEYLSPMHLKIGTFIAALSIGLLTSFNVGSKANAFRRAVREFTAASILYRETTEFTLVHLVEAYRNCENIVGDVHYVPQWTKSEKESPGN